MVGLCRGTRPLLPNKQTLAATTYKHGRNDLDIYRFLDAMASSVRDQFKEVQCWLPRRDYFRKHDIIVPGSRGGRSC